MKKGLKLTLMTVAVAALGVQAMAMAPTIKDIPSPVVGNEGAATGPNSFVYPDAIDLDQMVSDDATAPTDIKWAFYIEGSKYKVNGRESLTQAESVLSTPPAAKELARQAVADSELDGDSKTNTITIRNQSLSPLGSGTAATPISGVQDVQPVFFFASDGSTSTLSIDQDIFFYTDNGGSDRMSGTVEPDPVKDYTFDAGAENWTFKAESYSGAITTSSTGGQLSMTLAKAGDYVGQWISPWPAFSLTADSIYRIRLKMNFTQLPSTTATVPFWDVLLDNFTDDASHGKNTFGVDFMVLDVPTEGSGYAIPTNSAGTDYTMFWAPAATGHSSWNNTSTGFFTPTMDGDNDVRLQLRSLDVSTNPATSGADDGGVISLMNVEIVKFPANRAQGTTAPGWKAFNSSNFTMTSYTGISTTSWSGETLAYTPNSSTASGDLVEIFPGDAQKTPGTNVITDNYVLPWTVGKLYRMSIDLKAPAASDVAAAPDYIMFSIDTPTQECNMNVFQTNVVGRCGMPQTTAETFSAYYYVNADTKSAVAGFNKLMPRFSIGNNSGWNDESNSTNKTNMGKLELSNFKVEEVEFK